MMKKLFLFVAVALLAAAGLACADSHKDHGLMVALDDVEWAPIEGTPLSVAVIWGDPSAGPHVRFVKLPAGFVGPIHAHTGDYHGVNLSGTWQHVITETGEVRDLPPGSYVFQPGGEMHADACVGLEDCVLMIYKSVANDFILQEK
jgi:quercetin dioxygenase-like cupin family protein